MIRRHAQGNRGKLFETIIDRTNLQYRAKGWADVRKIPTPVQIQSNVKGRITGYVTKGELTDYFGVADGRAIVFDAKETAETKRFPLKNLEDHQFRLLESWHEKGAFSFLLVRFSKINQGEVYLLPFSFLSGYWEGYKGDGPKSIPYDAIRLNCEQVQTENGLLLHYLKPLLEKAKK